jgi:hypothetical protein
MELTKAENDLLGEARHQRRTGSQWALAAGMLIGLLGCLLIVVPTLLESGLGSTAAGKTVGFVLVVAAWFGTCWEYYRFRTRALSLICKLAATQDPVSPTGQGTGA